MAERFARGGRLVAIGRSPIARSDVRHVAVEFVHPVIVGKRALPAIGLAPEGGSLPAQVDLLAEADDIVIAFGADEDSTGETAEAVRRAAGRGCLTIGFGGSTAEQEFVPPRGRPVHRAGAGRDALPRALGAGARLLRAPRAAVRPRGRAGARHRGLELPLPVPLGGGDGPRGRGRRRPRLDPAQGDARSARCASRRSPRTAASCSRQRRPSGIAWRAAARCWRSATAARRLTRWTSWPTSTPRRRGGRLGGRSTSPRTRRSSPRSRTTSGSRRSSSAR